MCACVILLAGFMEGEIDKSKITIVDNGRDPDAPSPNAVLDLYVSTGLLGS